MPKKQNTYEVEGKKTKSFDLAAGRAVDIALQRGESITIIEHGQTGDYYINVSASAERAD